MKTSNIIIIAYVVAILIGLTVLFSSSTKHVSEDRSTVSNSKGYGLPPITVVVALEEADVHIHQADFDSIHVEIEADSIDGRQFFHVSNDTLYAHSGARMYVKCKNPLSIIGQNAYWIGLGQIKSDSIDLDISGGQFHMNYDRLWSDIDQVNLKADSAQITFRDAKIGQTEINASNKSKVDLSGEYDEIKVKLYNESDFHVDKNPKTLYLERHD